MKLIIVATRNFSMNMWYRMVPPGRLGLRYTQLKIGHWLSNNLNEFRAKHLDVKQLGEHRVEIEVTIFQTQK